MRMNKTIPLLFLLVIVPLLFATQTPMMFSVMPEGGGPSDSGWITVRSVSRNLDIHEEDDAYHSTMFCTIAVQYNSDYSANRLSVYVSGQSHTSCLQGEVVITGNNGIKYWDYNALVFINYYGYASITDTGSNSFYFYVYPGCDDYSFTVRLYPKDAYQPIVNTEQYFSLFFGGVRDGTSDWGRFLANL